MDGSGLVALFLVNEHRGARSALPKSPRISVSAKERTVWAFRRGQLANLLHRLAWSIEPEQPTPRDDLLP